MMNRVLLAVDGTKGSDRAAETLIEMFASNNPGPAVTLVYVKEMPAQHFAGESMAMVPEMGTILQSQHAKEYQEALNAHAQKIMSYYKCKMEKAGISRIQCIVKAGFPAEEILSSAKDVEAELIIIGSRGKRPHDFLMGSVSREVANCASIPILVSR